MNKKKWALLIVSGLLVFGYVKLFYKTFSKTAVAKSSDYIIALDVKRITNTLIWQWVTTPSQWKMAYISKSDKQELSWKDMVELPDYIFAFHVKNQPVNAWYAVLQVKDDNDFVKGLQGYHFEKINTDEYINKEAGICILKKQNKILVSTAQSSDAAAVANELFTQKLYVAKETLAKVIDAKSHLALYIGSNGFLQQDGIVTANFDKEKIEISSTLTPQSQYSFTENDFAFSDSALCTLGFTQPSPPLYALLSDTSKKNISKALSINIDSLLLPSNKYYSINMAGIQPRVDSAITYEYDDNFNKVEKVVVNNVEEPAFNFTIAGDSVTNIYNYWERTGTIDQTDTGALFTAMPFVKTYCHLANKKELNITAANYQNISTNKKTNCIFFLNMLFSKIPTFILKYLPGNLQHVIANMELLQLVAKKNNNQVILRCNFYKKNNDLPLVKW